MTFDQAFKGDGIAARHFRHQGSLINLLSPLLRHEKRTTETNSRLFVKPGKDFAVTAGPRSFRMNQILEPCIIEKLLTRLNLRMIHTIITNAFQTIAEKNIK